MFVCPRCGCTTYSSVDEANGWCPDCKDVTKGEKVRMAVLPHLTGEELRALSVAITTEQNTYKANLEVLQADATRRAVQHRLSLLNSLKTAVEEARGHLF